MIKLQEDETLLVQSGKPVGVFRTHTDAPRVLLANSNIVPAWATQENFDSWEAAGLIMYGQMTAGSWIYIGTQGILQGTYETLGSLARQAGWRSLRGKLVITAGLGEMGGAQPLAITMNEGVGLIVEVDRWRAERRLQLRQIDVISADMEEAMTWADEALATGTPRSIGLIGNAAAVLPELVARGVKPDVVTDQTSAHDPLYGYIPAGLTIAEAADLRQTDPQEYVRRSTAAMTRHVQAMLDWKDRGAIVFDYGNNLRQRAFDNGLQRAFDYPGFVPAYIRPLFCEGKGPFRWVALSGDPEDIYVTDRAMLELFPEDEHLARWIRTWRSSRSNSRVCRRASAGWATANAPVPGCASTSWSPAAQVKAPIVIGRDHLDSGSVASPNRETEAMRDGSDAIADWPLLNALVNAVNGATWVSIHHGGGVGIGYSIHAGQVIVADGTPEAALRLAARPHQRPRHGRRAPRRRRLPGSNRLRPRPRRGGADDGTDT